MLIKTIKAVNLEGEKVWNLKQTIQDQDEEQGQKGRIISNTASTIAAPLSFSHLFDLPENQTNSLPCWPCYFSLPSRQSLLERIVLEAGGNWIKNKSDFYFIWSQNCLFHWKQIYYNIILYNTTFQDSSFVKKRRIYR